MEANSRQLSGLKVPQRFHDTAANPSLIHEYVASCDTTAWWLWAQAKADYYAARHRNRDQSFLERL